MSMENVHPRTRTVTISTVVILLLLVALLLLGLMNIVSWYFQGTIIYFCNWNSDAGNCRNSTNIIFSCCNNSWKNCWNNTYKHSNNKTVGWNKCWEGTVIVRINDDTTNRNNTGVGETNQNKQSQVQDEYTSTLATTTATTATTGIKNIPKEIYHSFHSHNPHQLNYQPQQFYQINPIHNNTTTITTTTTTKIRTNVPSKEQKRDSVSSIPHSNHKNTIENDKTSNTSATTNITNKYYQTIQYRLRVDCQKEPSLHCIKRRRRRRRKRKRKVEEKSKDFFDYDNVDSRMVKQCLQDVELEQERILKAILLLFHNNNHNNNNNNNNNNVCSSTSNNDIQNYTILSSTTAEESNTRTTIISRSHSVSADIRLISQTFRLVNSLYLEVTIMTTTITTSTTTTTTNTTMNGSSSTIKFNSTGTRMKIKQTADLRTEGETIATQINRSFNTIHDNNNNDLSNPYQQQLDNKHNNFHNRNGHLAHSEQHENVTISDSIVSKTAASSTEISVLCLHSLLKDISSIPGVTHVHFIPLKEYHLDSSNYYHQLQKQQPSQPQQQPQKLSPTTSTSQENVQEQNIPFTTLLLERLGFHNHHDLTVGGVTSCGEVDNDFNFSTSNLNGTDIRIAIVDTGIDYTHAQFGGPGTTSAYERSTDGGYGSSFYFPSKVIVGGYDFTVSATSTADNNTSENNSSSSSTKNTSNNPIDVGIGGHGTSVAHIVHTIAPGAQLLALKVCFPYNYETINNGNSTSDNIDSDSNDDNVAVAIICPDYAIVQGLEYVVDPNGDGSFTNAGHVINLSLGQKYSSSYFSIVSATIDDVVTAFDITVIVAAGNHGNIPYVMGSASGTRNAITVGATTMMTTSPLTTTASTTTTIGRSNSSMSYLYPNPIMAPYSSRGPTSDYFDLSICSSTSTIPDSSTAASGGGVSIKPDVVAPGGTYRLASSSTGTGFVEKFGTSFSAPIVTGIVALLLQKCGSSTTSNNVDMSSSRMCSPLAIKSILMNTSYRNVFFKSNANDNSKSNVTNHSTDLNTSTTNTNTTWNSTNVEDNVTFTSATIFRSPVSYSGAGEVRADQAFRATFWVYSLHDVNPSISFGIVNAATSIVTITRTLRIIRIPPRPPPIQQSRTTQATTTTVLRMGYEFRNPTTIQPTMNGVVVISFEPSTITWIDDDGNTNTTTTSSSRLSICNKNDITNSSTIVNDSTETITNSLSNSMHYDVNVTFLINGTNAPTNRMMYSGLEALDPNRLNDQEVDGWITVTRNTETTAPSTSSNKKNFTENNNDTVEEMSVPFHMILRKAAHVTLQSSQLDRQQQVSSNNGTYTTTVDNPSTNISERTRTNFHYIGLKNNGTGMAQIDMYQLMYQDSNDDNDQYYSPSRGSNESPHDIRYVGYRTVPVPVTGVGITTSNTSTSNENATTKNDTCSYLLEFAIVLQNARTTLSTITFFVYIDVDNDNHYDYVLFNSGPLLDNSSLYPQCQLYKLVPKPNSTSSSDMPSNYDDENKEQLEAYCTNYPPDHSTNTANTVLRVCNNELGLPADFNNENYSNTTTNNLLMTMTAKVRAISLPYVNTASVIYYPNGTVGVTSTIPNDTTDPFMITYPLPVVSAPSYNVLPGDTVESIPLTTIVTSNMSESSTNIDAKSALGLLMFTNAYRDGDNTGSATRETEAIVLLFGSSSIDGGNHTNNSSKLSSTSCENFLSDVFIFPVSVNTRGPSCSWWQYEQQQEQYCNSHAPSTSTIDTISSSTESSFNSSNLTSRVRQRMLLKQGLPSIAYEKFLENDHRITTNMKTQKKSNKNIKQQSRYRNEFWRYNVNTKNNRNYKKQEESGHLKRLPRYFQQNISSNRKSSSFYSSSSSSSYSSSLFQEQQNKNKHLEPLLTHNTNVNHISVTNIENTVKSNNNIININSNNYDGTPLKICPQYPVPRPVLGVPTSSLSVPTSEVLTQPTSLPLNVGSFPSNPTPFTSSSTTPQNINNSFPPVSSTNDSTITSDTSETGRKYTKCGTYSWLAVVGTIVVAF